MGYVVRNGTGTGDRTPEQCPEDTDVSRGAQLCTDTTVSASGCGDPKWPESGNGEPGKHGGRIAKGRPHDSPADKTGHLGSSWTMGTYGGREGRDPRLSQHLTSGSWGQGHTGPDSLARDHQGCSPEAPPASSPTSPGRVSGPDAGLSGAELEPELQDGSRPAEEAAQAPGSGLARTGPLQWPLHGSPAGWLTLEHPRMLSDPHAGLDMELRGAGPLSTLEETPQPVLGSLKSRQPSLQGHMPGGKQDPRPAIPMVDTDCSDPAWALDALSSPWASRSGTLPSRVPGGGWGARRHNSPPGTAGPERSPSHALSPMPGMPGTPWDSIHTWCRGQVHAQYPSGAAPGISSPSLSSPAPGAPGCQPRTHVFFLKVHKSASSTIANILFRFGDEHGLRFAMPAGGAPHFFYPRPFQASFVEGFSHDPGPGFHIMCQHMRFQPSEVRRVLPPDTFYFTILRDPARVLESAFSYYKASSPFARARGLGDFLARPGAFYDPRRSDAHYGRDLQAFDLGLVRPSRRAHPGVRSPRHLRALVRAAAARFPLVLIAEHLDASLVLLGRALCWPPAALVAFPANRRAAFARQPLPPAMARRARAWSALDWALYSHFNRTLWARLDALGPGVHAEVAALRRLRARWARTCLVGGGAALPGGALRDPQLTPLSHGLAPILGYALRPGLGPRVRRTCRALATPELQYARRLYRRQFPGSLGGVRTGSELGSGRQLSRPER
ncbi:uncharacterized protein LOC132539236 [Erinaceus europaeus]|uniref:Uncharacterized protein LOC132539236 n=1 Tax=Erinaceus europaeus TaxID=9365 RepID=A0ABM3XKP5_ERIEU|nr:uncharacterized protein LOC132539236 [Erinaceus europaeus]